MWLLTTFVVLLAAIAVLGVAVANTGAVLPELVLWEVGWRWVATEVPVPHLVAGTFVAGVLLTLLVFLIHDAARWRQLRRLRRRLRELETEMLALRRVPLDASLPHLLEPDGRD